MTALVVIEINAILAAILFPLFPDPKQTRSKT